MLEIQKDQRLPHFISIRKSLENYLIHNRALINQVVRKFGTKGSGYVHVREFYADLIKLLQSGTAIGDLTERMRENDAYKFLQPEESPYDTSAPRFSSRMRPGIVMRNLIDNEVPCVICGGKIPCQSISVEHIKDVKHGGLATVDNGGLAHPYCNSAKDKLIPYLRQQA